MRFEALWMTSRLIVFLYSASWLLPFAKFTNMYTIHVIFITISGFLGVDSHLKFTIRPLPGDDAFTQWKDAMRAVARLPLGLPTEFRKKVRINTSPLTPLPPPP